jgi:hypothetical protein
LPALLRSDEDHGAGASFVDPELISGDDGLLLGGYTQAARKTVDMVVLNDGIDVVLGLAWDLLTSSYANVRDETTFEVLLEEFPDLLGTSLDLLRFKW